jgi:hypothetical protein
VARRHFALAALAVLLILGLSSLPAYAQATRTWVSGVGDDANPCSRTAPCKTFAGAISKTAVRGVISVLDAGGFGAVTITKSITIENEGFNGGILVAGTNGVTVNAGAGDVVILRGLTLHGVGSGLDGIKYLAGGALHVENCTINGFATNGIEMTVGGELYVVDTLIRNIGGFGILVNTSTGKAVLDRVRVDNAAAAGIRVQGGATASIRDSMSAGNQANGLVAALGSRVSVEHSVFTGNGETTGASGVRATDANTVILLSNTTITFNGIGISTASGGLVSSFGNNQNSGNGLNGAPSGLIAQQ